MKAILVILSVSALTINCMRIGRSDFKAVSTDLHQSAAIQGAQTQALRFELAEVKDMDYLMEILDQEPKTGQFIYKANPKNEPLSNHPVYSYNQLVKKGFFLQKTPMQLAKNLDYYYFPEDYNFIVRLRDELKVAKNTDALKKLNDILEREYKFYLEKVATEEYPLVVDLFKKKDANNVIVKARLNLMHANLVGAAKRLGALRILNQPYQL